jgi:hypothetical protein
MTDSVPKIIEEIQARGKSLYYIAKLMRRQYVQVQRMKETGRCQPVELEMLKQIQAELMRDEGKSDVAERC